MINTEALINTFEHSCFHLHKHTEIFRMAYYYELLFLLFLFLKYAVCLTIPR